MTGRSWLTVFITLAIALTIAGFLAAVPRFTNESVATQTRDVFTEFLSSGHAHFGIAAIAASIFIGLATFGLVRLLNRRHRNGEYA